MLGEPAIKMLRYQQQFAFFDQSKLDGQPIRFINLSQVVLEQDLGAVLEEIVKEVEAANARHRRGGLVPHRGAQGAGRGDRAKWSCRASSSAWRCT